MATYCEVTGRRPSFGKAVSHSHRRTNAQGIESVVARLRATDADVRRRLGPGRSS